MARILIVGGGCRGRRLASSLLADGHAVRITTRSPQHRSAIEAAGAECWVGTPDRLATLRGALDGVTVACWLLGCAHGTAAELSDVHGDRLRFFLTQAIDTTVRGVVYEARGSVPQALLDGGAQAVVELSERHAIPRATIAADPGDEQAWQADASAAIAALL